MGSPPSTILSTHARLAAIRSRACGASPTCALSRATRTTSKGVIVSPRAMIWFVFGMTGEKKK
jgi:hypothetical protein